MNISSKLSLLCGAILIALGGFVVFAWLTNNVLLIQVRPSLRTTNPIESTLGTIRHQTTRTKGCLTRDGMLHMMFKLGQYAEKTWRRLRGFRELPKVIAGIQFIDGIEHTTSDSGTA